MSVHPKTQAACIGVSAIAIIFSQAAYAQISGADPLPIDEAASSTIVNGQTLETEAPPGFESLTAPLETFFDIFYLGRRLGSFRAVLKDGTFRLINPEQVVAALEGQVSEEAATKLLSAPLSLNEEYRCVTGQTSNCGILPRGQEGVIVNPERFSAELFFSPANVIVNQVDNFTLGPAETGPSLIQTVNFAAAKTDGPNSSIRFGATFDTAASIGQTALLARTIVDDEQGAQLLEGTVQHVWNNRIGRAGLFEDLSTKLLTSYRMVGAEFASFYPRKAYEASISTPIQIVLPREADVELRRRGVLISVRHYQAGLQVIDTSGLPEGSYQLGITARADGAIILQEERAFTRARGLPLKGKTEFSLRAGMYAPDQFPFDQPNQSETFFPRIRNAPVVGVRASRRIGEATALELNLLHIDGANYAESSITTVRGNLEGFVSVAAGDDGAYGVLATGTLNIKQIRFSISARKTKSDADNFNLANLATDQEYLPFSRSDTSVFGSMHMPLSGGSYSVSAGYTKFDNGRDAYSVDLRYTKSIRIGNRRPLLTAFGRVSNRDSRVGASINFLFGLDRKTSASVRGGAEYIAKTSGSSRKGLSPVLDASISRLENIGDAELLNQVGVSTNADSDRAFASSDLRTSYGQVDLTAQYQRTRSGGDFTSIFANGRTGFAVGGGKFKLGLADVGQAVILSDIKVDDRKYRLSDDASESGYRIRVNSQPFDRIKPGRTSAVGVAPYDEYEIDLEPENAPPFEVDTEIKRVTLYPGNVAYFRYEAVNSFAIYGQMVDQGGKPIANGRVKSDNDITLTDEQGFFLITVSPATRLEMRLPDGQICRPVAFEQLTNGRQPDQLLKVGAIKCLVSTEAE